jgi:hypothetical protein
MLTLFYGAETWTIKAPNLRRLTAFYNRCIHIILGITKDQQWKQHITAAELASAFGMTKTVDNMLITHRLQ